MIKSPNDLIHSMVSQNKYTVHDIASLNIKNSIHSTAEFKYSHEQYRLLHVSGLNYASDPHETQMCSGGIRGSGEMPQDYTVRDKRRTADTTHAHQSPREARRVIGEGKTRGCCCFSDRNGTVTNTPYLLEMGCSGLLH